MINSLKIKDLTSAREALENGANPEAILGGDLYDHAVCTAIDDSSSRFLELLVEYGASANAYWPVDYDDRRTPLSCTVYLWNFEAFDYLLDHGADPSVQLLGEPRETNGPRKTAFTMAVRGDKFPMALKIVNAYGIDTQEQAYLANYLETYAYNEAHPWNYAREKLIEWARQRVPDFKPLPATPSPNGVSKECYFSFRDYEENRKTGSVCPEPEKH